MSNVIGLELEMKRYPAFYRDFDGSHKVTAKEEIEYITEFNSINDAYMDVVDEILDHSSLHQLRKIKSITPKYIESLDDDIYTEYEDED